MIDDREEKGIEREKRDDRKIIEGREEVKIKMGYTD